MGNFIFHGISAADMGLVVERRPRQTIPRKRITSYSIPGRSGDLHEWDGAWENFPMSYDCWFQSSPVAGQAHKIKAWLSGAPVGARLEDTYDAGVFHHATYVGGAEIENLADRFGRFTVTFDCAPQGWLTSGEQAVEFQTAGIIDNPTSFDAYPLIEFTGHVSGTIQISGVPLTILFPDETTDHTIQVDFALQEAWELIDGAAVPTNTAIISRDFPPLTPGRNSVDLTGGIDVVKIIPRWWQL